MGLVCVLLILSPHLLCDWLQQGRVRRRRKGVGVPCCHFVGIVFVRNRSLFRRRTARQQNGCRQGILGVFLGVERFAAQGIQSTSTYARSCDASLVGRCFHCPFLSALLGFLVVSDMDLCGGLDLAAFCGRLFLMIIARAAAGRVVTRTQRRLGQNAIVTLFLVTWFALANGGAE